MYAAASVALALFFISLAVSHFFITDKKWARRLSFLCAALGAAGLAAMAAFSVYFFVSVSKYGDESREWAVGVLSGYFKDVLPALAVILLILILSAVFQPKMRPMRIVVSALSSILLLVYGYVASYLSQNGSVSVSFYLHALSISGSLAPVFCQFFDFRRLYEKLSSENTGKKSNKVSRKK